MPRRHQPLYQRLDHRADQRLPQTMESIGIRTTAIRDVGNNVKAINNSGLRNILNRSTADSVAVTNVSVSHNTDIEQVEKVIADFLSKIWEKYPNVFPTDPKYDGVQELGESGVMLKFMAEVCSVMEASTQLHEGRHDPC